MNQLLKILSIASLAGIVLLSIFTWFSADDLCNLNELARYSVPKMAWLQYMNWDGRSLSIAAFVQLSILKYLSPQVATFCWATSFVGVAVLILKIVRIENPLFCNRQNKLIATAVIAATAWLGLWKMIPDIIYWPTGGSYSFMNLIGLFWLSVFLADLKAKRFGSGRCTFILFLSFICGNNSHNFIIGLLVIVFIELAHHWFLNKDKVAAVYISYALAGLLVAACIVFLAPGNSTRLSVISYHGISSRFLYFYLLVLTKYGYWLMSLFALCVYVAWISGSKIFFLKEHFIHRIKEFLNSIWNKKSLIIILHQHKFLFAAMATITVFFATSYFATPRTGIFFATFLLIYFFQQGWKEAWGMNSRRFRYGSVFFLSLFICVIAFQMMKANAVKQQLSTRELLYEKNKGMDVAVTPVPKSSIPFAFLFVDISADSSYWVNRCVALHYELKTVRTLSGD